MIPPVIHDRRLCKRRRTLLFCVEQPWTCFEEGYLKLSSPYVELGLKVNETPVGQPWCILRRKYRNNDDPKQWR
ncbi:hypothetical protein L6452_33474 [Arctium lappa]|uniref:Uncharacterized protein n=1 Tax=Arctium lappa TaxID=4217 RepID=A0ACB8YFP4_ARCLA|nr:hypothetical protein L6452_33474 [Arctium lappa]